MSLESFLNLFHIIRGKLSAQGKLNVALTIVKCKKNDPYSMKKIVMRKKEERERRD